MSADNGVYVVKFPDGYRVAHAQAIENIDYFPEGSAERKAELKAYFGDSILYESKDAALLAAHRIEDKILEDDFCPVLEYGVCYLGEYEAFE